MMISKETLTAIIAKGGYPAAAVALAAKRNSFILKGEKMTRVRGGLWKVEPKAAEYIINFELEAADTLEEAEEIISRYPGYHVEVEQGYGYIDARDSFYAVSNAN